MSYVVNAFACLVNIEIPGENMKGFVSNHTPDRIQISGGYFCMDICTCLLCTSLEVIDLVAYKSGAEGCVENARDWLYICE